MFLFSLKDRWGKVPLSEVGTISARRCGRNEREDELLIFSDEWSLAGG